MFWSATVHLVLKTNDQQLQNQVYIISGVFGGVTLVLCLMILGLAYSISKSVSSFFLFCIK